MLHVILFILKIIGIILLSVLAVLLLLLLMLLFVPFRYGFQVKKEDNGLRAEGGFSWLLHFAAAHVSYADGAAGIRLRVLWFTIKTFEIPKKGRKGAHTKKAPEHPTGGGERTESDSGHPSGGGERTESDSGHPSGAGEREENIHADGNGGGSRHESEKKEQSKTDTAGGEKTGKPPGDGILAGIRELLSGLPDLVLKGLEHAEDLLLRIVNLPCDVYGGTGDRLDRVTGKLEAIGEKAAPFRSIEFSHVLHRCMGYLMFLARGFRPRRIDGYLDFGTDSPDLTGKLYGLILQLLPRSADAFEIRPDFYEQTLRTDVTLRGCIRLYRIVYVAVRLLLDKEFRILLHRIRRSR